MTFEEAKKNVELMGVAYRAAMETVGVQDKDKTMNLLEAGIVAYYLLRLEGQWEWLDESITVVVRKAVDLLIQEGN